MKTGAWNALTVTVADHAKVPLDCLGVQFNANAPRTGTCYMDSVSW